MNNRHHMGVRELDLRDCSPSVMADRVVPGLRSSAAFFIFLRANLALSPSAVSSNANTPYLEPWSSKTLPSVAPTLATNPPLESLDDIPSLSLEPLQSKEDKDEGLKLVAASVSQMKQRAAESLVSHPLCLGALSSAWAALYSFVYVPTKDVGTTILLAFGALVTYLWTIRYVTAEYVRLAEQLDSSWIQGDNVEDIVVGAHRGGELVGALVLRLEPKVQPSSNKRRRRNSLLKGGKGVIRAWTTKLQHRGSGIGKDLLAEAVRITRDKCGKDAEIGFAKEHANSTMVLPSIFNHKFRKDEARATEELQGVVAELETNKRRKR